MSNLTSFSVLVTIFAFLIASFLILSNHYIIHHTHPNACAMTYFQGELTPMPYSHPFYELAEFGLSSSVLPATHEIFISNDEAFKAAQTRSFPTLPSHPEDESQHLVFFLHGNAGSRWQVRSLVTKMETIFSELRTEWDTYSFNGVRHGQDTFEPNLTELPPKLSYMLNRLSPSRHWRSKKAFYSKFYQAETIGKIQDQTKVNRAKTPEWYDSTMDLLYKFNMTQFLNLNPDYNDNNSATLLQTNYIDTHVYTFGFNEQSSAFSGFALESQQEYAVYSILQVIKRFRRQYNGKVQVSFVGHSMGGVVALSSVEPILAAIEFEKLNHVSIASVITLGTPVVPLFISDHYNIKIFDEAERFALKHEQCHPSHQNLKQQSQKSLCSISVSHIDGGQGDEMVPTAFTAATRYQHHRHQLTLSLNDLSIIRGTADHQCLAWCGQVMEEVATLLIRKVMIDSLVLARVDLIKTVPDPHKAHPLYPRPEIQHISIPLDLLNGHYDFTTRLEFQTTISTTLPPSSYFTHSSPLQIPTVQLPTRISAPINAFTFSYGDVFAFIRSYQQDMQQIQKPFPSLSQSVPISSLLSTPQLKSHPMTALFTYVSQFSSTLQLCPNDPSSSNTPLHNCLNLNQFYSQPLPTPALSYLVWRRSHTFRATPDNADSYLSRSSSYNSENNFVSSDAEYIKPQDLSLTQHGFAINFTLYELFNLLRSNRTRKQNGLFANQSTDLDVWRAKYEPFLTDFDSFVNQFSFQSLLTPPTLEGLFSLHRTMDLDISLQSDISTPLVWSTIMASPEPITAFFDKTPNQAGQVVKYQLLLGQSDHDSIKKVIPSQSECQFFSAALLNLVSYPILSLDVTIYIPPTTSTTIEDLIQHPIYHLTQTHHFGPESPYLACLLPSHQRFVQSSPSNTIVDLVAGRLYPRPDKAQQLEYAAPTSSTKYLDISTQTTFGLLPVPRHLTGSILDSVTVLQPQTTINSSQVVPVLLPTNSNLPMLPAMIKHIFEYLATMSFSLLTFSIQLLVLRLIYRYYQASRQNQWLSTMVDYFDNQDIKQHLNKKENSPAHRRSNLCSQYSLYLFRYIFAATIAIVVNLLITVPLVFLSNPLLEQLLPEQVISTLKPIIQLYTTVLTFVNDNHLTILLTRPIVIFTTMIDQIVDHYLFQLFHLSVYLPVIAPVLSYITYSIEWVFSWFSFLLYFVNHSDSPLAAMHNTTNGMPYTLTQVEYHISVFVFYSAAYILSSLIMWFSELIFWIITIPIHIWAYISSSLSFLWVLLFDVIFPLGLLFGYAGPLVMLFAYSLLLTTTEFLGTDYFGSSLLNLQLPFFSFSSIIDLYQSIHCFFKQGVYFAIHIVCIKIQTYYTFHEQWITTTFFQTYPRSHLIPTVIAFFKQLIGDLITYTRPAEHPDFVCLVHPHDYQLLPFPITTTTILFIAMIWTLSFVLFIKVLVSYQFDSFKQYLTQYHNEQQSQQVLLNVKKINPDTNTDEYAEAEAVHLLNRILAFDYSRWSKFANYTFYSLSLLTLLTFLLIFPSSHVITDVVNISMNQSTYRELYQGIQSATLPLDQFHLKLSRNGIEFDHFQQFAQDTASFSLFYPLLNKFYPSQTHNPHVKTLLTAQWYQQQGAWLPTIPVDVITRLNFPTSFAFSFLLLIQLLALCGYFTYSHNCKVRAIEIKKSLAVEGFVNDCPGSAPQLPTPFIEIAPQSYLFLTNIWYYIVSIPFSLFAALICLPYLSPSLFITSNENIISNVATSSGPTTLWQSIYQPLLTNGGFPLLKMLTPYHQSIVTLPMFLIVGVISIFLSFDYKLVLPNEVERGYKHNPIS